MKPPVHKRESTTLKATHLDPLVAVPRRRGLKSKAVTALAALWLSQAPMTDKPFGDVLRDQPSSIVDAPGAVNAPGDTQTRPSGIQDALGATVESDSNITDGDVKSSPRANYKVKVPPSNTMFISSSCFRCLATSFSQTRLV